MNKGKKATEATRAKLRAASAVLRGATADRAHWTAEEDAMLLAGAATADVAAKTGRSAGAVYRRRRKLATKESDEKTGRPPRPTRY